MNIKTKIRAFPTIPNKNKCVSIGSMLAVQYFYEKLNFSDVFSRHKSKGLDLNSLLIGLVSYKLTENFSIKEASKWLNQKEILEILNLKSFHEKVLYRTLEILGRNKEIILSEMRFCQNHLKCFKSQIKALNSIFSRKISLNRLKMQPSKSSWCPYQIFSSNFKSR
jgi:transposase